MSHARSMPPAGGKEPVARTIGQTLATVQHLADLVLTWGFKSLKKMSEAPSETGGRTKGMIPAAKRVALRPMHFLGSMGDAYYEWYNRMKAGKSGNHR